MVDRVTEVVSGRSIRGHKCVAFNEPWFQGHFPSRPIYPGVLILESLAQIGGILAYASDPFDPQTNLIIVGTSVTIPAPSAEFFMESAKRYWFVR